MRTTLQVMSFVYLLLSASTSFAATYYVAKTGNDAFSCTQAQSGSAPKQTIQAGVLCARAGDTVIVRGGTYSESVGNWPASGTSGQAIVVRANDGDTVVWNGGNTSAVFITNRSYIRIEGFTFQNMAVQFPVRVLNTTGNKTATPIVGIEIVNNKFINNGVNGLPNANSSTTLLIQGIGRDNGYSGDPVNRITGNTFSGNYGSDVTLAGTSDTLVADNVSTGVRGSKDGSNGGNFVARFILLTGASFSNVWHPAQRNVIERNTISDMSRSSYVNTAFDAAGIRMDSDADRNTIRANVIHDIASGVPWSFDQRGWGIYSESRCDNNRFSENIVSNVSEACYQLGSESTIVATGNQVINNVGNNCSIAGLILANAKSTAVKNNIFYNNGRSQVYVTTTSVANGGHVFSNNNYWRNGSDVVGIWNWNTAQLYPTATQTLSQWGSASGERSALSVNPQFVSAPSDFHLLAASPVKGAGENGVDLGAYPTVSVPIEPSLSRPINLQIVVE